MTFLQQCPVEYIFNVRLTTHISLTLIRGVVKAICHNKHDVRKVDVISKDNRKALTFVPNFGIPDKVISDNGTSFSSHKFKEFMDNTLEWCLTTHPAMANQKEWYKLSNKGYRTRLMEL